MHAIRLHAFGGPEQLRYEEVPDPQPGPGEVRIAVEAAGVHLLDTTLRRGDADGPAPLPDLPATPGREVAGVVDAVGAGVEQRWLGRRAVAHLGRAGSGGYAQLVITSATSLQPIADHVTADGAVAMIGTGRTATGVLDVAALTADDVVLVTAAAGGLGNLFVQEACAVGATVVGLAGGEAKIDYVRSLGAHAAIDYRGAGWPDRVREALGDRSVTLVLDGVGGEAGRAALALLGPGGRLVMFGYPPGGAPTQVTTGDIVAGGLTVSWATRPFLGPGAIRALETRALEAATSGRWAPRTHRFPLADAAAAHAALERRATMGKVVLVPA